MNDGPRHGAVRDIAIFALDEARGHAHACGEARACGLLVPAFAPCRFSSGY